MQIIKISQENLEKILKIAERVTKGGGVVICPTDTVYGLIADAKNGEVVKKVFKIKKRNFKKPIPIFVKDLKMAKNLAFIDKIQEKFLKKVWPGKVTVVLKARYTKFPKGILSQDKKIGLRIPNYKLLNNLLKKLNFPLAETSANISGRPPSTKIKEVLKQFKCKNSQLIYPDLILDAGNLKPSLPSTVVDLERFKILREGEFSKRKILRILKTIK